MSLQGARNLLVLCSGGSFASCRSGAARSKPCRASLVSILEDMEHDEHLRPVTARRECCRLYAVVMTDRPADDVQGRRLIIADEWATLP